MCGIVAYIGHREATPILLEGLKRLEYRGYDSAGVAVLRDDRDESEALDLVKSVGRVRVLEDAITEHGGLPGSIGIAHTRWATHGGVTEANAHPHRDDASLGHGIAIIHNGIIENYQS
ncbi:MAG: glutamine--fructose-6-phosphate aminotransferase, partial [Phycisphaeraceae bacterium]|nr:glutamine--fructose-6-phosphate aminotransferase [Phycisphaeraceae bacterium]